MFLPKLKIGLDYHGVIDTDYKYFAEFAMLARRRGHQIYVISGAPRTTIKYELSRHNFPVDFIFSILDYCLATGKIIQTSSGVKIADDAWNKAKADFCLHNRVDWHIDDNKQYCDYFTTFCCYYQTTDHFCYINGKPQLNFNLSVDNALIQLEKISAEQMS